MRPALFHHYHKTAATSRMRPALFHHHHKTAATSRMRPTPFHHHKKTETTLRNFHPQQKIISLKMKASQSSLLATVISTMRMSYLFWTQASHYCHHQCHLFGYSVASICHFKPQLQRHAVPPTSLCFHHHPKVLSKMGKKLTWKKEKGRAIENHRLATSKATKQWKKMLEQRK